MQKPIVFIQTSTKCVAILIKNTKLFTITHRKQMGANLTKHVQDLYAENYTILIKQIKEDLNKHIMFMDQKTQTNKDVNSPQIVTQV